MVGKPPRVSIGLPVYNGDNYIREAIDSVLAQTFTNWELVVCDNCSNDSTEAIMRSYVAQDPRIRYIRNETNLGAAPNHNLTMTLSRGEYFKLYAHDDKLEPTFLARCVEVLDRDPGVVNCHTKTMIIDSAGKVVKPNPWHLRTDSPNPRTRFHDTVWVHHHCFQIYGVIRREALMKTPLLGTYMSSDQVLLAELSLHGRFHEVPEFLFLSRRHQRQSVNLLPEHLKGRKVRSKWFTRNGVAAYTFNAANANRKLSFHMWRVVREYIQAAWRTPVSWPTKLWCTANMFLYFFANAHKLTRDVLIAGDQLWQQSRFGRANSIQQEKSA